VADPCPYPIKRSNIQDVRRQCSEHLCDLDRRIGQISSFTGNYLFDEATAASDPGDGYLRFNTAGGINYDGTAGGYYIGAGTATSGPYYRNPLAIPGGFSSDELTFFSTFQMHHEKGVFLDLRAIKFEIVYVAPTSYITWDINQTDPVDGSPDVGLASDNVSLGNVITASTGQWDNGQWAGFIFSVKISTQTAHLYLVNMADTSIYTKLDLSASVFQNPGLITFPDTLAHGHWSIGAEANETTKTPLAGIIGPTGFHDQFLDLGVTTNIEKFFIGKTVADLGPAGFNVFGEDMLYFTPTGDVKDQEGTLDCGNPDGIDIKFKGTSSAEEGPPTDAGDLSLITEIYISDTTTEPLDVTEFLDGLGLGQKLRIRDIDSGITYLFDVTSSSVDNGDWFTIPVTFNQATDNDFPVQENELIIDMVSTVAPVDDHGNLDGLADDDHPHYHNDARGDARYTPIAHASDFNNPHQVEWGQLGGSQPPPIPHTHAHADTTGQTPDDHHAQDHKHDGIDGSGTVAHQVLTNILPDDHHPQAHIHDGLDGSGTVAHAVLTGITPDDHHNRAHDHSDPLDGTVDHDSLSNVTADQHHPQAHAHNGADGSGTVAHSDLTGITTDDHHAQVHALYGPDHSDVDTILSLAIRHGLFWRQAADAFAPEFRMNWRNTWGQQTYYTHDVVVDGAWTMAANKETNDRPAPQPIGSPAYTLPDLPAWTFPQYTGSVFSGIVVQPPAGELFQLQAYRVWIPDISPNAHYQVVVYNFVTGSTDIIASFDGNIATAPGWLSVTIEPVYLTEGGDFAVILHSENSSGTTDFNHPWVYTGSSQNDVDPGAGSVNHNNQQNLLRISETDDDSVSRATELGAVVPGTTIRVVDEGDLNAFYEYSVVVATDMGTWWMFDVLLVDTGASGGPGLLSRCQTYFEVPIAAPTEYVQVAGAYTGTEVQGYLNFDTLTGGTLSTTGYGVDIQVQQYSVSPDWDLVANSASVSSGDGGGGAFPEPPDDGVTYGRIFQNWIAVYTKTEADALFAPIGHNHDGVYAPVGHNHDGVYAPVGHNHDGVYAPVIHTHVEADITDLDKYTQTEVDNLLAGKSDTTHGHTAFAGATTTGFVPDPIAEQGYVLSDSGAWIEMTGGGGGTPGRLEATIIDDISGSFNGILTSFPLNIAAAPAGVQNPEELLVSVNGVIQDPSVYTVLADEIVFDEAPRQNSESFILWYQPREAKVQKMVIPVYVETPQIKLYPIIPQGDFTHNLTGGYFVLSQGTCTLTVKVNGAPVVGLDNIAVTTTPQTISQAAVVGLPARIELDITAASIDAASLETSIYSQRDY
jgi:hypothetical protein